MRLGTPGTFYRFGRQRFGFPRPFSVPRFRASRAVGFEAIRIKIARPSYGFPGHRGCLRHVPTLVDVQPPFAAARLLFAPSCSGSPQHDGAAESDMIGLFADIRHFNACTEGLNYLGVVLRLQHACERAALECSGSCHTAQSPIRQLARPRRRRQRWCSAVTLTAPGFWRARTWWTLTRTRSCGVPLPRTS